MEEAPVRRDYARDGEDPVPFKLASLGLQPGDDQRFYQVSSLTMHTKGGPSPSVAFPSYLLASKNHTDVRRRGQHRRLKNCIVLVEWCPNVAGLVPSQEERPLTAEAESQLEKTFKMFDRDGNGTLDASEVSQVLRSLDVVLEDDSDADLSTALDMNSNGTVDLAELRTALARLSFFGIQDGRYFVLLSLPEAESLRGAMHVAKTMGVPLVPGAPAASISMRVMPSGCVPPCRQASLINCLQCTQSCAALCAAL